MLERVIYKFAAGIAAGDYALALAEHCIGIEQLVRADAVAADLRQLALRALVMRGFIFRSEARETCVRIARAVSVIVFSAKSHCFYPR